MTSHRISKVTIYSDRKKKLLWNQNVIMDNDFARTISIIVEKLQWNQRVYIIIRIRVHNFCDSVIYSCNAFINFFKDHHFMDKL